MAFLNKYSTVHVLLWNVSSWYGGGGNQSHWHISSCFQSYPTGNCINSVMFNLFYTAIVCEIFRIANKFFRGNDLNHVTLQVSYPPSEDNRSTSEKLLGNHDDKHFHLIFTNWLHVFCLFYQGFFSLQFNRRIYIETLFID